MVTSSLDPLQGALLGFLAQRGLATSNELQALTGMSQPTVSRALAGLSAQGVVTLGRGRATRYGLCRPILGVRSGQQAVWRYGMHGNMERWGTLTWLAGEQIHVQAQGMEWLVKGELPWFLAPLRMEGFLGRLQARRSHVSTLVGDDPSRWGVEQQLYVATSQVHDAPGAMTLGSPEGPGAIEPAPTDDAARSLHYDRIAANVADHLPAGSSAAGEQAKFLVNRRTAGAGQTAEWEWLLVKFTPPRGTPFGERWNDLLHAEALALATLADAGEPVARARVLSSGRRTYLESVRFDRIGGHGRRHAVPLWAVHKAFVNGPSNERWTGTCDELERQKRLSAEDAQRVRLWRLFGNLIGNNDMHAGNLSLWADDPRSGRFTLAPCYDMLPMAYKPEPVREDFGPTPLTFSRPPVFDTQAWTQARALALRFWHQLGQHEGCSAEWRAVASENARRIDILQA